jgi:hypothetical protein
MVAVLFLVVFAMVAAPHKVKACSGDDCGCTLPANCEAACPPAGDPGHARFMTILLVLPG